MKNQKNLQKQQEAQDIKKIITPSQRNNHFISFLTKNMKH